jgi:tRNA (guanine6-N2)-methyltransferase
MTPSTPRPTSSDPLLELVIADGLVPLARAELLRRLPGSVLLPAADNLLRLRSRNLREILQLRLVNSAALVCSFAVPRPKALLGDQHLRRLLNEIAAVRALHPAGSFQTLFISAAGNDSSVMQRLSDTLCRASGLQRGAEDGDLLLRVRPDPQQAGWQVLIRISPRPLATRSWRVCNLPGALNGPAAAALITLAAPPAGSRLLNIGCGSGSLLIEALHQTALDAVGCDIDAAARSCAEQNLAAAGLSGRAVITDWDAAQLPLPAASVTTVVGDLPFGHLVGSHAANLTLYPQLLDEAARVVKQHGRTVLLSHEVRLMQQLIQHHPAWSLQQELRIDVGGLFPRIFVLLRR